MRSVKDLSEDEVASISQSYNSGKSLCSLAGELDLNKSCLSRVLKRRGVTFRPHSIATRKYLCNHNFFTDADTENKVYWLGFITADG